MRLKLAIMVMAMLFANQANGQEKLYAVIDPPQPTSSGPGKIEVIEWFGFWCGHCADFAPELERWREQADSDIVVIFMPVTLGREDRLPYSLATYAIDEVEKDELKRNELRAALFAEVKRSKEKDPKKIWTQEDFERFAIRYEINGPAFKTAYESKTVTDKVAHAEAMARAHKIVETPTITVQGHYLTRPRMTRSVNNMLPTVDEMVRRARSD